MSSLVDLPEEILIIIIKQLDIKSVYNLYESCAVLKNVIVMQGVIRVCNLSCNTLSTPKSLQTSMIKDISEHLYELNMCGVSNLTNSFLLPAIKMMKSLKTLDVSYTDIKIFEMLDIYKNCPTIRNISINCPAILQLMEYDYQELQEVFKNFINVHFVLNEGLSNVPLHILRKSSLDMLKYTLCDTEVYREIQSAEIDTMCLFNHFCIFMMNYKINQGSWKELLPLVKVEDVEFIIVEYGIQHSVCTSPLFINFFSKNFKLTPIGSFDINKLLCGVLAIFIWNKKTTTFDKLFFSDLKKRIKKILTCKIKLNDDNTLPSGHETNCYNWIYLHPIPTNFDSSRRVGTKVDFKTRFLESNKMFDYDKILREHKDNKLKIYISHPVDYTLLTSSEHLTNLTYLNLAGSILCNSNEFFKLLFRRCKKLITLNAETPLCCTSIIRYISLSPSLKNIRIVDNVIDFKMLFSSLAQCKTLENISVTDISTEDNELADLCGLFNLVNLYIVHIRATIKESIQMKMENMSKCFNKSHPEHYVHFVLEKFSPGSKLYYNPYVHVFNLTPIKPV